MGCCDIAGDPVRGVIDTNHKVFGYPGLYVVDASAIPVNVGGNPSLRITALAERWASLIDRFMEDLACFDFPGGSLDVRENIRFRGGNLAAWTHGSFPDQGCVLSIEFKKFFMDEWTGSPDQIMVEAIGKALESTVPGVLEELSRT